MPWVLSLDVGTRTIGLAKADVALRIAQPWTTLRRTGVAADVDKILDVCGSERPDRVVVGLPLGLDGEETRSTRLARQVGDALSLRGLSVVYQDERFSTVEATRRLHEAGLDTRKQRAIIDQAAAAVILQDWLDSPGAE